MSTFAHEEGLGIAFVPRFMTWASFPYVDQKDSTKCGRFSHVYERQLYEHNQLIITTPATAGGTPYGALPRLIMLWVAREAIRNKSKKINLGNIRSFMRELGMAATGGESGSIARLRNQMQRLFCSSIMATMCDETTGEATMTQYGLQRAHQIWDPKNPDDSSSWAGELILSDAFFDDILQSRIPISLEAMMAFRRYPMAMDMLIWLGYRMYGLKTPLKISWRSLLLQFGHSYGANIDPNLDPEVIKKRQKTNERGFRRDFKKRMELILRLFPITVNSNTRGIVLYPSPEVSFVQPSSPKKSHGRVY